MQIKDILLTVGLQEHEARVYLAALELNESTVLPIAKKAGVKRTYCYDILADLMKKGLITYFEKNNRRRYVAENPEKIADNLKNRLNDFKEALPELRSIYNTPTGKPKVRYYEGREGVISLYEEVIKSKTKSLDAIASPTDIYGEIGDYFTSYIKKSLAHKIKTRELITKNGLGIPYLSEYKKPLQEARVLPETVKISTDMMIYDNKLAMISYGTEIHAVVIESSEIVQTQKALFELLWQISKNSD